MSTIAFPAAPHTPPLFCDQRFKCIRLTGNFVSKLCLSIFCTAISYLTCLFSKKISDQTRLWSHIYFAQCGQLFFYLGYGNQVIDFSMNFSPREQKKTLEETFGREMVERCTQAALSFSPIEASKLKTRSITEGCCMGMSLDWIATYLKEAQKGNPPLNAIRSASLKVREGASKEAELAQILGHALDGHSLDKKAFHAELASMRRQRDEKFSEIMRAMLRSGIEVTPALMDKIKDESLLSITKENMEALLASRHFNIGIEYASSLFGLAIQKPIGLYLPSSDQTKKPSQDYLDWINQLKSGAYYLSLNSRPQDVGPGHALALIKTSDKTYFFDPNIATLAIDPQKSADTIWDVFQRYLKGGDLLLGAIPLSLASHHSL